MLLVIPAAGRSERMGTPKGLRAHGGEPLLLAVARWTDPAISGVILVLGFHAEAYLPVLTAAALPGVWWVTNPDPARGPFSSVQVGLAAALGTGAAAVAVLPLDVPVTDPFPWSALVAALPGFEAVVPTFAGRDGHPVVLGAAFARGLVAEPASWRLDRALAAARVARVAVDDPRVGWNWNEGERAG